MRFAEQPADKINIPVFSWQGINRRIAIFVRPFLINPQIINDQYIQVIFPEFMNNG